jgi:ribosomal protein S12 methylthiotransferase accessory factor
MEIEVRFPGGKRVDAEVGGFEIRTDQPVSAGGQESAPDPFTLFLASLATCAGIFALGFCQARNISTEGLRVVQHSTKNAQTGRLEHVAIEVVLPPGFPEHYRPAIMRAVDSCKVKKTLADPPTFEVRSVLAEGDAASATGSVGA